MAQLKDLIVTGASSLIGNATADTLQVTTLRVPTTADGTTYGPGANGNILMSNGSSTYWSSGSDANFVQKTGDTMSGSLYVNVTTDTAYNQDTGAIVVGDKAGVNIAIDSDEIMARNNKATSTLYINNDGGTIQFGGTLQPKTDSATDIGTTSLHWRHGYFDDLFVSTNTGYTATNSAAGGTAITTGQIDITGATPKIQLHRATAAAITGTIQSETDYGITLNGVPSATGAAVYITGSAPATGFTYSGRTVKPILRINGVTYSNACIETGAYFLNNTNGGNNTGYFLYGNNNEYARLYIGKRGTAAVSDGGETPVYTNTTGETILVLGNAKQGSSGNSGSVVDNSKGILKIYGAGTQATDIQRDNYAGLHISGNLTASIEKTTYNSRTITPLVKIDGLTYIAGEVETNNSFSTNSSGTNNGVYIKSNNIQVGKFASTTLGKAGTLPEGGTEYTGFVAGVTTLELGNSKQVGSATSAGDASNAYGVLTIFGKWNQGTTLKRDETSGLHITGTLVTANEKTTYNSRTINPLIRIDGLTYVQGVLENSDRIIINRNGINGGYFLKNRDVEYGSFYVGKLGTAAASNGADPPVYTNTVGESILLIGNNKQGKSGNANSVIDNSKGILRIYGQETYYTDIQSQPNGNRTYYLPTYAGDGALAHVGVTVSNGVATVNAVGSHGIPTYVAENGRITACTQYTTCGTAVTNATKTATLSGFVLATGAKVVVNFTAGANTADSPTLNINSTGAKNIFHRNAQITTGDNKKLLQGACEFIYDGTQYHLIGNYYDTNTTYSAPTTTASGLVPALPSSNGTSQYLRGDGTWATIDLSSYAPLASPALTGTPTAPTATAGTNTTQIATTEFVTTALSNFSGTPSGGTTGQVLTKNSDTNYDVGWQTPVIIRGTGNYSAQQVTSTNSSYQASATGEGAFALGAGVASGQLSFAGGAKSSSVDYSTTASANGSFAYGLSTKAEKNYSVAFGQRTTAKGLFASAFGNYTIASGRAAMAIGQYNIEDTDVGDTATYGNEARKYLFTIGNGTADNARSNALTVDWDGNVEANTFIGDLTGDVTGNADTATAFSSAKTIALTGDVTGSDSTTGGWSIATTLANTGVTADSYGLSVDASPSMGGTFTVPYITVDSKGRLTAASTKTVTLPSDAAYLTKTEASSTYLTQTTAANTYLPITTAASTYVAKAGDTMTGNLIISRSGAESGLYVQDPDKGNNKIGLIAATSGNIGVYSYGYWNANANPPAYVSSAKYFMWRDTNGDLNYNGGYINNGNMVAKPGYSFAIQSNILNDSNPSENTSSYSFHIRSNDTDRVSIGYMSAFKWTTGEQGVVLVGRKRFTEQDNTTTNVNSYFRLYVDNDRTKICTIGANTVTISGTTTISTGVAASNTENTSNLMVSGGGTRSTAIELLRAGTSSWQLGNISGHFRLRNNWDGSATSPYFDAMAVAHTTGNVVFPGTLTVGQATTQPDYGLLVSNGIARITSTTTIASDTPAKLEFGVTQTDNNITSGAYIAAYDDHDENTYGTNMVIQCAGNMIIGGGESPSSVYANAVKGKTEYSNATTVGANAAEFYKSGENLLLTADGSIYFLTNCNTIANRTLCYLNTNGYLYTVRTYGAVWNDYAEYRKDNKEELDIQQPGRCVREIGDGSLALTTKRLERGCEIISDTFGFAIGEDKEHGYNTPIASNGRVLAYPYENIEEFKTHIGWPVCSGPNGTVSIMTEEEEEKYPSRIIGTISEIPSYKTWGTGNVEINGRVWIRIR